MIKESKHKKKSSHQENPINQGSDNVQGWEIKKLGEIGKVSMCKRVFKEDTTPEGDIPFYKIGTFGKSPDAFITKAKYDEFRSKFSFPKKGDILISASGTIGRRVRYDGEPAYFQDSNIVWIDNDEKQVLNDYLYRFYEICNWKSTKGATISRLYNDNLKQIEIPFPKSLPEQQRIVSILDECFAAIDKAKANAEQNLKNAKELFESVLNSLIIDDGNSRMEKLGNVCEIKGRIGYRGYTVQDLVQKGEGAITLSPSNIQDNKFISDKCTYISWFKYDESPEIKVYDGDILFVKTGSTYGKVALVENLPEKATINPQFVVFKEIKCSNKFLFYALTTRAFKEKVESIVGGAATPTLSQTNLAEQTIPLPSLKEQQTIVRQLDSLRAKTQKLEAVYQKKMADLEELKKSILQKAFAGELKTEKLQTA